MRFPWFRSSTDKLCRKYCLTPDVPSARSFIERYPDILAEKCDGTLRSIAERLPDEDERQFVMGRRMLLEHCRKDGVEKTFAAWTKSPDESIAIFFEFMKIDDVDHLREYIESNPVLFDYPTREVLSGLLERDPGATAERLQIYLRLFDRSRYVGLEAAFAELESSFWADPLAPLPAGMDREPTRDPIARCAAMIELLGVKGALTQNPALAMDPRIGVALLRAMLLARSWNERIRYGLLRAELARARRIGTERAIAEDWRIEVPFSEQTRHYHLTIRPALQELTNLDDLHRLRKKHPEWLDQIAAYEEQREYLNIPTPTMVSGEFAWEAMYLMQYDPVDDEAVNRLAIEVGKALLARADRVPPYLRMTTHFVIARAYEHDADLSEAADAFETRAATVQALYDAAYAAFPAALVIDRASIRKTMAEHLLTLARLSIRRDESVVAARKHLEEAAELAADDDGHFLPGIDTALGGLWLDFIDDPDATQQAVDYLKKASEPLARMAGGALWEKDAAFKLGRAYLQRGDTASALAAFVRRIELHNIMKAENPFPAGQRKEAIEAAEAYQLAALCQVRLGNIAEALRLIEGGRVQSMAQVLRARHWEKSLGPGERAAKDYIDSTRTAPLPTQRPGNDPLDYGRQVEQVRRAHEEALEHALAESGGGAIEDIALLLSPGSSAVSITATRYGLIVVITNPKSEPIAFEYAAINTESLIEQLFRRGSTPGTFEGWLASVLKLSEDAVSFATTRATMDESLETIRPVLARIVDHLPLDTRNLAFVLDGRLAHLPIHAVLLDEATGERVLDRYTVSYAPSFAVYAYLLKRQAAPADRFLGYANTGERGELTFAELETKLAASRYPDSELISGPMKKQHLLGKLATRTVIHFACHASYDAGTPDNSALDLGDEYISLMDIERSEFDLAQCRLVTLSACHTSMIGMNVGQEQVGLPAAFVVAGAQCVVGSLWEAPDLTSALLMNEFYRHLSSEGSSPPVALRAAQLWLRKARVVEIADFPQQCLALAPKSAKSRLEKDAKRWASMAIKDPQAQLFAHPYFWAGYAAVGT